MDKRLLTACACALTLTACADRGDSETSDGMLMQEFLGGDNSGPGSSFTSDGVGGGPFADNNSGDNSDTADAELSDGAGGDTEETNFDVAPDGDSEGSTDVVTGDVTGDSETVTPLTEDETPVVTTSGGRVLLPGDCNIVSDVQGLQYCLSPSAGNRLFALQSNGDLRWTTTLSSRDNITDVQIIPGDGLFVVRKPADGNTALLTSLDDSGTTRYEATLSGDFNEVLGGLYEAPYLFLHTTNANGNSSILQLDADTGRQNLIRSFPGQRVSSFQAEQFDDVEVLSIVVNGVTLYLNLSDLSDYTRIFSLDPTNYRENLPGLMANLRGEFLVDYIALLGESITLVSAGDADGEVACPGAGSINLLPANSFVSNQQFTHAYEYTDCEINGLTVNGSLIHTYLELDTVSGSNGSETLSIENLVLSKPTAEPSATGEETTEDKTLTAMVKNIFVFSGDDFKSERTIEVDGYTHTYADTSVLSIASSNYTRLIDTEQDGAPAGGYGLSETGAMRSVDANATLNLVVSQPLTYLQSEAPAESLSDAPLSGVLEINSSDRSTLTVDASRGGVNLQNYFLTQRGTEYTIDDTWPINPVDTTLRLLN